MVLELELSVSFYLQKFDVNPKRVFIQDFVAIKETELKLFF